MADRTWQIEHRGEFRLALRRATSLPRGNKRDYVSYKTLVRWRFACALRGSARGFRFIDPLGLRPRGLCTVATRACHVNHAPPSYNYNIHSTQKITFYLYRITVYLYVKIHTLYWYSGVGNEDIDSRVCEFETQCFLILLFLYNCLRFWTHHNTCRWEIRALFIQLRSRDA